MPTSLCIFPDLASLSRAAAQHITALAGQAIDARGAFHVALAGGATPRRLYRELSSPEFAARLAWDRVHVYFGDERAVPPEHPESNYRMARETLLDRVSVPAAQVHPLEGWDNDLQAAAQRYARLMGQLPDAEDGAGRLDLVLLGVGADGHTASLFPGSSLLAEREQPVAAGWVEQLGAWRLSLTLPLINRARAVLVLAAGEEKAAVAALALGQRTGGEPLPIELVQPDGDLAWYLDEAAASRLPAETVQKHRSEK